MHLSRNQSRSHTKLGRRGALAASLILGLLGAVLPSQFASASPPSPVSFLVTNVDVTSGSPISLHWGSVPPGDYFLLASNFPNFGNTTSPASVSWPTGSDATWNSAWSWWKTTSSAAVLSVPSSATAGSSWYVDLYTCVISTGECSNYGN